MYHFVNKNMSAQLAICNMKNFSWNLEVINFQRIELYKIHGRQF